MIYLAKGNIPQDILTRVYTHNPTCPISGHAVAALLAQPVGSDSPPHPLMPSTVLEAAAKMILVDTHYHGGVTPERNRVLLEKYSKGTLTPELLLELTACEVGFPPIAGACYADSNAVVRAGTRIGLVHSKYSGLAHPYTLPLSRYVDLILLFGVYRVLDVELEAGQCGEFYQLVAKAADAVSIAMYPACLYLKMVSSGYDRPQMSHLEVSATATDFLLKAADTVTALKELRITAETAAKGLTAEGASILSYKAARWHLMERICEAVGTVRLSCKMFKLEAAMRTRHHAPRYPDGWYPGLMALNVAAYSDKLTQLGLPPVQYAADGMFQHSAFALTRAMKMAFEAIIFVESPLFRYSQITTQKAQKKYRYWASPQTHALLLMKW